MVALTITSTHVRAKKFSWYLQLDAYSDEVVASIYAIALVNPIKWPVCTFLN